jgi:hypothetical protein
MDFFTRYDARAAADEPIEHHLRDQETGESITLNGKPCIVLVRGLNARSIDNATRSEIMKEDEPDLPLRHRLHAACVKAAAPYIAGFKNMMVKGADGKPRALTLDDVPAFLDLNIASAEHGAWVAPKRGEDESEADYKARVDADRAVWRGASFAQQILDVSRDEARFLARRRGS